MQATPIRARFFAAAVIFVILGTTACSGDNNPYGPPYREKFSTIAGAYRPFELLVRELPFLPGEFQPAPDGSDIRFVFGTRRGVTGRVFVPGGAGGADLDERITGEWSYDVPAQELTVAFDSEVAADPGHIVFQISFLVDRVRLRGSVDIAGVPFTFDLGKPLPPEDAPDIGGGNFPSFNRVPMR